jgi:two-component system, LytTR family, sensor histidine kinase AlgZ
LDRVGAGITVRAVDGAGGGHGVVRLPALAGSPPAPNGDPDRAGYRPIDHPAGFLGGAAVGRRRNFGFGPPAPLPALLGNQAISGIITLLALRYFYVQHQWKQHVEAEARARFQSLQSRIHPHFLFNTLNTIAGLIRTRPDQAEQAVLDLGDLLRSALANQERITLGDELELTRRYLAIEHLRMGDRLQVDWQLAADLPLDTPLPALLLQPLVENAVHHGIQSLPEGGQLTIRIAKQAHGLRFTITNPRLSGASDSLQGQRLAQDNIRQRLLLVYGVASRLEIAETAERYQVAFTVPLVES